MSERDAFTDGREQGWRDKGRECEKLKAEIERLRKEVDDLRKLLVSKVYWTGA